MKSSTPSINTTIKDELAPVPRPAIPGQRGIAPAHSRRFRADPRILLVDDDATVRDSLNDVLLSAGYCTVIPAENGQQALDFASEMPVDLVLLDLNMPVKNGWDTFEQFTREHPLIPVIIATARPNQLFTAVGAGASALLEKPMDIPALLRTIEKLLAESADQRLARLAGQKTDFHYERAAGSQQRHCPANFS